MSEQMRLENWWIINDCAWGNIYNNPKFADGDFVRTSPIKEQFPTRIVTANSEYLLGKQAEAGDVELS